MVLRQSLFVLLLAFIAFSTAADAQQNYRRRTPDILCENGEVKSGVCVCKQNYAGKHCEREMHCLGYERHQNFSCIECEKGWMGTECDFIDCGANGTPLNPSKCECIKPFSGKHCDELTTKDVYLLYNTRMYNLGPLGCLVIIPLVAILLGCKRSAQKRQVKRVEKAIEEMHKTDVDSEVLENLLTKK
ncbi:Protein F40A3.2 [Aphelenchoides avenae]|nr:Protein F40A3.2 [Aphelenchus avenae]